MGKRTSEKPSENLLGKYMQCSACDEEKPIEYELFCYGEPIDYETKETSPDIERFCSWECLVKWIQEQLKQKIESEF